MNNVIEFVKKYIDYAKEAEKQNGIDYRITLTQAALESGFGKFAFGNNFFGVKAGKSWTGKKQLLKTNEESENGNLKFPEIISITPTVFKNGKAGFIYRIRDWFRAYDSPLEGFLDRGKLIATSRRYKAAMSFKNDPEQFFIEIQKAGYATDTQYAKKLQDTYQKILLALSSL